MKKYFKYLLVGLVLVLPLVSMALEFRAGDQTGIKKDEKITNDIYMGGGSVNSAGMIQGDLVAGGGNVIVSGDVAGDVMVGGGNVNIISNVGDDVRVGGGTLVLMGKVGGDVLAGGGQINIGGAGIEGDVAIAGGSIRIDAPVKGKVLIEGGDVFINSLIGGDVKINADKLTLGSSAVLSGNISYTAKKELIKEGGAIVKGEVSFTPRIENKMAGKVLFSAFVLWRFFALLACALLIGLLLTRFSREITVLATERPMFEVARGLLVIIVMPVVSALLFVTMVGIPLGALGLLGFIMIMLFTWMITPIIVGSVVYQYFSKKELEVTWKTILLGAVVCTLLGLIPFVGWLAKTLLFLLTLGSMTTLKLRVLKEWR